MNNLNEIKQNIINHFNDDIIDSYDDLILIYKKHYTEFKIRLSFEKKNENYVIKYDTLYRIKNIKKRRTLVKGNFYKKLENNISFIKKELEPVAESEKVKIDNEKKYCSELKSHFIKKHERVNISVYQNYNRVKITINCYDYTKGETTYHIYYKNNKYYLESKLVEHYNKIING